MRFFVAVFATVTLAIPALASPVVPLHEIRTVAGETSGRYIVKLKDAKAKSNALAKLSASARTRVTHDWDLIHGFAGNFDAASLDALRRSPDVEYIEEDGVVSIVTTQFVISL